MIRSLSIILLFVFGSLEVQAVPAVLNYAGQVAVNGQPFDGQGLFKFALVSADGNATYWSNDGSSANGSEPAAHVIIPVNGGLYSLLLGNTAMAGMGAIDPQVFAQYGDAKLRVWFSDGVNGFQQLSPDRPFASVPYAFSAGTAQSATIADGSINKSMLGSEVIAELNATIGMNRLSAEVTAKLDQNGSGGSVLVAGSLISVPYGQSAPAGYSLYQRGTPKALVWEEKAPVSVARGAADGFEAIGDKIYFVGGFNGAYSDVFEVYDTQTNIWQTLITMPNARSGHASAVINENLYVISGLHEYAGVDIFDPATNSWDVGVSLQNSLTRGRAITFNEKIYLIGGRISGANTDQVLKFDPILNIWEQRNSMPTPRHNMNVVEFNDKIWAVGGNFSYETPFSVLSTVESYDPINNVWSSETSLIEGRNNPIAWVNGGYLFVAGGKDNSETPILSIERYDPHNNEWSIYGTLPFPTGNIVVVNNKLYLKTGATLSGVYSDKVYAADLNASIAGVYDLYHKDGIASAGTPLVQAEVADGSVTTAKIASNTITTSDLSEQILKYLKPEITAQPQPQTVYADSNASFSVTAAGKYLTYQWKKDSSNLTGETNATLNITDANDTQHDGNYSVVVSNDFGSVETGVIEINIWIVGNVQNLALWLDASNTGSFVLSNTIIQNWKDLSGNGYDMNITDGNASLTGLLNGKTVALYDGDDVTATTKNFSNDLDQSGYSIVALSRYAGGQRFRVITSGYGEGSRNWLFGHHGGKHSTFFAENWVDRGTTGDLNWHIFSVTHEPAISHNNGVPPLTSFWLDGTNRILNSGLSSDGSPAPSDIVFGGASYGEKSACEVAEFIMIAS